MKTLASSIAALGKLISGLQKYQPNGTLLLGGKTYTTAAVVQVLQSLIDAMNASVTARAAFLGATSQTAALSKDSQPLVRDLRQAIQIMYGQNTTELSDFGLAPRKKTTVTPAAKAAAADKAKATREARHTMGKRQKAKITGSTTVATTSSSAPAVPLVTASAVTAANGGSSGGSGSSH